MDNITDSAGAKQHDAATEEAALQTETSVSARVQGLLTGSGAEELADLDSLALTEFASKCSDAFDIDLSPGDVHNHTSASALAKHITEQTKSMLPVPPIDPPNLTGPAALPMWLVHILQFVGILVAACVPAMALIPTYHLGHWLQCAKVVLPEALDEVPRCEGAVGEPWSRYTLYGDVEGFGILIPMLIPTFMAIYRYDSEGNQA